MKNHRKHHFLFLCVIRRKKFELAAKFVPPCQEDHGDVNGNGDGVKGFMCQTEKYKKTFFKEIVFGQEKPSLQ